MSEIQEAIKEIKQSGLYGNQVHQETLEIALSALQNQAEREKGCEWCNKGLRFECNLIDSEGNTASIENNVVQTCIADFCPNCGRDLRKPVSK